MLYYISRNKMRLIPLLILISVAYSDNTLSINCGSCSSGIASTCITLQGAGLGSRSFPNILGCSQIPKSTYTLTCTPSCPNGCELKAIVANQPEFKQCSTTQQSQIIIKLMDQLYSLAVGGLSRSKKDWCACGSNSPTSTPSNANNGGNIFNGNSTTGGSTPTQAGNSTGNSISGSSTSNPSPGNASSGSSSSGSSTSTPPSANSTSTPPSASSASNPSSGSASSGSSSGVTQLHTLPPPNPDNSQVENGDSGLSGGAIAGIVIGSVVLIGLIALAIICLCKRDS